MHDAEIKEMFNFTGQILNSNNN